jgi:hypothetical protein
LNKDVVESIRLTSIDNNANKRNGVLRFTYLEEVDQVADEFIEPREVQIPPHTYQEGHGMLWLVELAQGMLGQ